jgi:SAM-dependent methyltransferase
MLSAALLGWFGRSPPADLDAAQIEETLSPADGLLDAAPSASNQPRSPWSTARLAVTDQLWGPGFTVPGGEIETLRLVRPLGLSSASSLLLVGVGGGGAASSIVRNTGAWVVGLEAESVLLKRAQALMKAGQFGKRASIEAWDPEHPKFAQKRHHHCLALEPLRSGDRPEPILDGLSQALKPGGQLVLTELVADTPLGTNDASVSRWARLERRKLAAIPTANAVTRMLARVGFDVRIVEDISDRHKHNAMIGWRVAVREVAEQKPTPMVAAQLVAEAEMWLLRVRLLREKRLKMMRWHAMGRLVHIAPAQPDVAPQ